MKRIHNPEVRIAKLWKHIISELPQTMVNWNGRDQWGRVSVSCHAEDDMFEDRIWFRLESIEFWSNRATTDSRGRKFYVEWLVQGLKCEGILRRYLKMARRLKGVEPK